MQQVQDRELYDYFLREMDYLRSRARLFSEDYDEVARELKLAETRSTDPHVELLLQSFAYLSANVRRDMALQANHLPNQLLASLYPHLTKSTPSMFVVSPDVSSKNAKFDGLKILEKGREFYTDITSNKRGQIRCTVSTCYGTKLRPFTIEDVSFSSIKETAAATSAVTDKVISTSVREARSTIRVSIRNLDNRPTRDFGPGDLRFFINGEPNRPHIAYKIYELLARDCQNILVRTNGESKKGNEEKGNFHLLDSSAIKWKGYDEEDAVLPFSKNSHLGYRIIQEYFLFPEKYLFFDLNGLPENELGQTFDIYFLLSSVPSSTISVNKESLILNAIPVINLYNCRTDSIRLNERDHEYRLTGDYKNHDVCEVHTIKEAAVIPSIGNPIIATPYAGIDSDLLYNNDRFYSTRLELSGLKSVPGTETYISIHKREVQFNDIADDVLTVKALCTNRRLTEALRVKDKMTLIGPGPILNASIVTKPTMHKSPTLNSEKPWRLLSQLVLNASALDKEGLEVLKQTLQTYSDENNKSHFSQIDSLSQLETRRITKHFGRDQWRGLHRGFEVWVEIDITKFEGPSLHLFGEILQCFFGLYVNINSFVQVQLTLKQKEGIYKTWPPRAGEKILL